MEEKSFNIITKRPDDMPYDDYKTYIKVQKKAIKKHLKGNYVWISRLYPTANILELVGTDEYKAMAPLLLKGATYIKPKE